LISENGTVLRDVTGAKGRRNRNTGAVAATNATTNSIAGFTGGQQAPMNWASDTVQNKVKSLANGAPIDSFQKGQFQGQTAYQASFNQRRRHVTVVLGEDGTVLASSPALASTSTTTSGTTTIAGFTGAQQAPMNWASETVQNKFKQMANGANIQNFEKGKYNGRTAYLGSFTQNGQTTTVVMGEDGTVLSSTSGAQSAVGAPAETSTGSVQK
jgi:hypothetical protein